MYQATGKFILTLLSHSKHSVFMYHLRSKTGPLVFGVNIPKLTLNFHFVSVFTQSHHKLLCFSSKYFQFSVTVPHVIFHTTVPIFRCAVLIPESISAPGVSRLILSFLPRLPSFSPQGAPSSPPLVALTATVAGLLWAWHRFIRAAIFPWAYYGSLGYIRQLNIAGNQHLRY